MYYTAEQISKILNGRIEGNTDVKVNRPSKIDEGGDESITFLANPKYEEFIYSTDASIVIVSDNFQAKKKTPTLIRVENVYESLGILLNHVNKGERLPEKVSTRATIDDDVVLHEHVQIGDYSIVGHGSEIGEYTVIHDQVYIGPNVRIGQNCKIYPGVRILHDCEVGDNVTIHSNSVIGSDGFGFARKDNGSYSKIPQVGNVIIENNVEIGSLVAIDRATMGETRIESGVKIDNLIQIAHNVTIGKNTVIAAQTGIAGSTKVGKDSVIGGQVGIVGHLKLPDKLQIQAQSGINSNKLNEGDKLFGSPALKYQSYLRSHVAFKNLPDIISQLNELQRQVDILKDNSSKSDNHEPTNS